MSPSKQQLKRRDRSSDFVDICSSAGGPDYEESSWSARGETFGALLELGERCALAGESETALNSLAEAALLEGNSVRNPDHPILKTVADYKPMNGDAFKESACRATPKRLVRALRKLGEHESDLRFAVVEHFTDVIAYHASRSLARAAALAGDGPVSRAANGVAVAIARNASRRVARTWKTGGDQRFQSYLLGAVARIADDGQETADILREALGIDDPYYNTDGRRLRLVMLDASLTLWPAHRSARVARAELARSAKLALADLDVLIGTTNKSIKRDDDDPRVVMWRAKRRWLKGDNDDYFVGNEDADNPAMLTKAVLQKEATQWSDALAKEVGLSSTTPRTNNKAPMRTSRQAELEASLPPPSTFDESCCVADFIAPNSIAAHIASGQEELRKARDVLDKNR